MGGYEPNNSVIRGEETSYGTATNVNMTFTALHRYLGDPPGPLTDAMVDRAVERELRETDDLDWKSELPPAGSIANSDFPKDVAAMANSGGGTLVFGVTETQKAATGRKDAGELSERYESALRSAAVTAISPPIFGLEIAQLGNQGQYAVAVIVPASVDGPHLIYKNEYFGAPMRNNADTVWMKERQVEAMYRARFDERRRSASAMDQLYSEAHAMHTPERPTWIIAIATPRLPVTAERPSEQVVVRAIEEAGKNALVYSGRGGIHPFESIDRFNPRPGLRRWVFRPTVDGERVHSKEAWVSIHHDGSLTLAAAVGGRRVSTTDYNPNHVVESRDVEFAVADFMGLIRETSERLGIAEYEVRVGIEWNKSERLEIWTSDNQGHAYAGSSIPLARYTPVEVTVRADADDIDFYWQVHDLAVDCINQGGISNAQVISPPARSDR